jgi:outer membrane protein assembly factor BamA
VRRLLTLCASAVALTSWSAPALARQPGIATIAVIQVQGNTLTSDAEVIQASGLVEGAPFSDALLAAAEARLLATKRFQHVDVLKRYASLTDPTQISVLIRVDEGPVHVVPGVLPGQAPTIARRGAFNLMYIPLFDAEDGYGLTYGVQMAVTGRSGGSRVVFPLSWGGNKRAGAEFQHDFASRLAPRLRAGVLIQRRTHPFYQRDADRLRTWVRGEWRLARPLFLGTTAAWQKASLLDRTDRTRSAGADLVLDTRIDPLYPSNAIYARAAIDRISFQDKPDKPSVRTELEADGYLAVYRGSVLALRVVRDDMSRTASPFFKWVLGGADTLRGFRAGTAVGDTCVATSAEFRIPLTSPLHVARFGTSVFVDAGTTYDKGQRFANQHLKRGAGGGVWLTAALFRISLMVAHGIGAGNRVHFGAGLTF